MLGLQSPHRATLFLVDEMAAEQEFKMEHFHWRNSLEG
jgi:hypothetical protein